MSNKEKFCLCCGEDVPFNRINRDGNLEQTCVYCGFVVDIEKEETTKTARCILIADDAPLIRNLLKELIEKHHLAEEVMAAENGQEFISIFNKRVAEKQQMDLAILDLEMPIMDGITAARLMRSFESKHKAEPIPILFFSAKKCDVDLKKQLSALTPASYVNKGGSSNPAQLAERVSQLVTYLLKKNQEH